MTSLKTNKRVQSIITNKCHSITPDFNALYQTFCSIEVEINMYHHTQIFNVCTTGAGNPLPSPPPHLFIPKVFHSKRSLQNTNSQMHSVQVNNKSDLSSLRH